MERSVRCAATAAASLVAIAFVSTPAFAQGKGGAATASTHVRIVADKFVVVDQHPITVLKGDKTGRIVWELPPKPSPWRFEGDSIAIDGGQFFGCHVEASGQRYVCTDRSPRTTALYPYRVTVYQGDRANARSLHVDSAVQNE